MKILCFFGIHSWKHTKEREWDDGFTSGCVHNYRCVRCGKSYY